MTFMRHNRTVNEQRINLQGAVDLGALAASRKAQEQRQAQQEANSSATGSANKALIVDVTVANFEADVLQKSGAIPVVLVFTSPRSAASTQLTTTFEKLVRDDNGLWVLAIVDVDATPEIAAPFQVQAVPTVFALVAGQPVPLFQGAPPEHKIREVLDAVITQAKQMGLSDLADAEVEKEEPPLDPKLEQAQQAIDEGDWQNAIASYEELLKENPRDSLARIGLLNVQLFARVDGVDFEQAINTSDQSVEAQLLAADCEFMSNEWENAFNRLIECIVNNTGDVRNQVRDRLLELFDIAGPNDAAVIKGRTALANALF